MTDQFVCHYMTYQSVFNVIWIVWTDKFVFDVIWIVWTDKFVFNVIWTDQSMFNGA